LNFPVTVAEVSSEVQVLTLVWNVRPSKSTSSSISSSSSSSFDRLWRSIYPFLLSVPNSNDFLPTERCRRRCRDGDTK
jgi:hypothetical protein